MVYDYDILVSSSYEGLIEKVKSVLLKGWEPVGGVCVVAFPYKSVKGDRVEYTFLQAMVRKGDD